MVHLKVDLTLLIFPRRDWRKSRKALVRTSGNPIEIRAGYFPNTRPESYPYSSLSSRVCRYKKQTEVDMYERMERNTHWNKPTRKERPHLWNNLHTLPRARRKAFFLLGIWTSSRGSLRVCLPVTYLFIYLISVSENTMLQCNATAESNNIYVT